MKFLISGGTGFLGNELGQALFHQGHELFALVRNPSKLKFHATPIQWDGTENFDHIELKNVEGLIHLVGEGIADKRWTESRKQILRDSRINTAHAIVKKLKQEHAPIRLCITASAAGYYGDRGDEVLTRLSAPGNDFIAKLCVDWENATKDAFPKARWIGIRTALVLAKNYGYLKKIEPMFKMFGASQLGRGEQYVSWIHLKDWVKLVSWAIENPSIEGPLNASSPNPLKNNEWTKELATAIGTYNSLPIPQFALRLGFGELAELLVASQRVVPERAVQEDFKFDFPDAKTALADIFS